MKKRIILFAYCAVALSYWGCSKSEDEICDSKPSFSALQAGNISYTSFVTSGSITPSACDDNIISQGIVYAKTSLPTIDDTSLRTSTSDYDFTIENLEQGTTYYLRPFLVNNEGEFYGQQQEVTTLIPGISFTEPTIQSSFQTVIIRANYGFTENVQFEITSKGFEVEGVNEASISDGTLIEVTVEDLELNRTISYRPFVNTEFGRFYGNQATFNTPDASSNITTFDISNISFVGALINTSYSNNYEGEDITEEVGVLISQAEDFVSETKYLGDLTDKSFTVEINNLTPNTEYFARAYVENEFGISVSETKQLITQNPGYDFVTLNASDIEYADVILRSIYSQIQGNSLPIVEKGFYISQSQSDLQTFKYISNSTDNTVTVSATSLESGKLYYFQAFIENQYGIFTSEISTFTTNDASPSVNSSVEPGLDFANVSLNFNFKPDTDNSSIILRYVGPGSSINGSINLNATQTQQDVTINNLQPNIEYSYSTTITNQYGTYTDDLGSFRTLDDTPQIDLGVTQTGDNQVTIDAQVTPSSNDTNISRVYLEYFNVESGVSTIELDPSLLSYNLVLDDLVQGPGYTFIIYASNTYNSFESTVFYTLPVTYGLGDEMFGGIIVLIDESGYHGLIAATNNNYRNLAWSTDYSVIDLRTNIYGDGLFNTNEIIELYTSSSESAPAAEYCNNLTIGIYNDWYLPAYDELVVVSGFLFNTFSNPISVGYIRNRTYIWSSNTDFNNVTRAISRYENTTDQQRSYDRNTELSVIPIRKF